MSKLEDFWDAFVAFAILGAIVFGVVWVIRTTNARHDRACDVWKKCLAEKREYECVGLLGDYADSCKSK